MFRVSGLLHCEEHGEFEVECDVDPPLYADQVGIYGECPECGQEYQGTAEITRR